MITLALATAAGTIEIRQDDLSSITDAQLGEFGISRAGLRRLFAEGLQLMQSSTRVGEQVCPCAAQTLDGQWEVRLGCYPPLMGGGPGGRGMGARTNHNYSQQDARFGDVGCYGGGTGHAGQLFSENRTLTLLQSDAKMGLL